MLGIAALSTLLGIISLISGRNDFSISAASTVSLICLAIISTAFLLLTLSSRSEKTMPQLTILILYIVSATTSFIAGGNIGLIPYIIKSMNLNAIQALEYVWPNLLISTTLSTLTLTLAYFYTKHKNNQYITASSTSA